MTDAETLKKKIRDVPDFPKKGILFKDITPLLKDSEALGLACRLIADPFEDAAVDTVVGMESRGFLFGPTVAMRLGAGFVPARKQGKLPWHTQSESYELEYGKETIEMHRDAVAPGDRILIVDDLIATGGTAAATVRLIQRMGGEIVGCSFLIELGFLEGRKLLEGLEVKTVLQF